MPRIALVRPVSPRIVECELTFLERQPIDYPRAAAEHEQYERALAAHGCTLVHVAAEPELADGVFVEDAVVVLDELAILTRPGAESRRPEIESVAAALEPYRPLQRIAAPGTIDGGDVFRIGKTIYVGRSPRTNDDGIAQLQALARGYDVRPVSVDGALHLKTAVTPVGERTLLINPEWVDRALFDGFDLIEVDPSEPFAANVLRLGEFVLMSSSFPRTRELLAGGGYRIETVELGEMEKAEAGITCCSVIFDAV
jgi:dimethylargininase